MVHFRAGSSRRGAWRAAVVLVLAPVLMAGLAQCDRRAVSETPPPESPLSAPAAPAPALPVAEAPLDRAGFIGAASRAASVYASGEGFQGADPLIGRVFTIRTPFACAPAADAARAGDGTDGLARAIWGAERRTLQLNLTPDDWTQSALFTGAGTDGEVEHVEGFWLNRPWLSGEACPAVRADPLGGGGGVSMETVGLAAVFTDAGSRIGRRNGRPYAFAMRGDGETPVVQPAGGLRLVLEGRIAGFPDGRGFRCRAAGPDQRPVCVAAVQLDRVAFTRADGTLLTEWRGG